MILLDTNVISEPMRRTPDMTVVSWLNRQVNTALFTTSITVMELQFGVARLEEGKRKANLREVLDYTLSRLIDYRLLPFDTTAAIAAARIAATAESNGTRIGQADCQIAAIGRSHGFVIATRDVEPFKRAGLVVINPWTE